MVRIIGILILLLSILLFPPSVLALISNNAVPGDRTYPIKIKLEEGVVFLASFNPTTKAWFSVTRSNRRYEEVTTLLSTGKSAKDSLNELVSQTSIAVNQVIEVEGISQKEQLITDLQKSLNKYDEGLAVAQEQITKSSPLAVSPIPSPTAIPIITPKSSPSQITTEPREIPSPTPEVSVKPSVPIVESTPTSVSSPTVVADQNKVEEIKQKEREIREAREKLEKDQRKLEEERRKLEEEKQKRLEEENKKRQQENQSPKKFKLFGEGSTTIIPPISPDLAPLPSPEVVNPCESDCKLCSTQTTCGFTTYDNCTDELGIKFGNIDFCKKAKNFKCIASKNEFCRSIDPDNPTNEFIYSCLSCNQTSAPEVSNNE